jgi:AcrR family transcriptional regulator
MQERFAQALAGEQSPLQRLRQIVAVYATIPTRPPVPGGCPLLNAAVEADDADPQLAVAAARVATQLERLLSRLLRAAVKQGELRPGFDARALSAVILAQLEGAVMLSKLHGSDAAMRHTVRHLNAWFDSLAP